MSCPACGQTNPAAARFCGACGASLDAVLRRRPALRRALALAEATGLPRQT